MTDRVAAVVVHYADPETTERCVRSLFQAGLRVIVVDNAATYGDSRPATEVIRPGANLGYGAGANLGLRRAFELAPFALLLNDDVTLEHPEGVDRLVARLEADPAIGIAGPLVLGPSGAPQPTVEEWPSAWRAFRLAFRPYSRPLPAVEARVEAVTGVCMVIRGAAFEAVQGFDERYFLYGEEVDLCRRMAAAGYRTVFVPAPSVVHHHPAGEVRGDAARQIRVSYVRFCRDHRGVLSAAVVALLFLTSASVRRRQPAALARGLVVALLPERGAVVDRVLVPALLALWVVFLALGSSYSHPLRRVGTLGKFGMLFVLVGVELPRIVRSPRRYLGDLRPGYLDAAVIAFVGFGALSALWSMLPRHTLTYAAGLILFFAVILLGPRRIAGTCSGARALATGIVVGTAVVLVGNVVAYAVARHDAVLHQTATIPRFRGFLESPDEIGSYVLVAPLVLWWALERARTRTRIGRNRLRSLSPAVAGLGILLVGEVALSGTRTSVALLVATGVIFVAGYLRGRRGALAAFGVTVVCVGTAAAIIASPALREQALPQFVRPSTLSTFGGRTEAWAAATHLIGRRPLGGYGLGVELQSIHLYRDDGDRLFAECMAMPDAWLAGLPPGGCDTLVSRGRRLVDFSGDNVHDSFLGLGVQLGGGLMAAAGLALLVGVWRLGLTVRRGFALNAALFACVTAGIGQAAVETYLFDPGNVVAGVFWLLLVIGLAKTTGAPKWV